MKKTLAEIQKEEEDEIRAEFLKNILHLLNRNEDDIIYIRVFLREAYISERCDILAASGDPDMIVDFIYDMMDNPLTSNALWSRGCIYAKLLEVYGDEDNAIEVFIKSYGKHIIKNPC